MSHKIVARGVTMDYAVRNEAGRADHVAVLRDFHLDVREGELSRSSARRAAASPPS